MIRRAVSSDRDALMPMIGEFSAVDRHEFAPDRVGRGLVPLLADDTHGQVWLADGGYAVVTWGWSHEPTIGLDVVSKQAVRGFLAELGRSGDTTVVLTTHDLADIERLSRRLVVIDHGRVVHDGTLDELHARYASQRRVEVDLDSPLPGPVVLPGVVLVDSAEDGRRLTFALADGSGAGALVAHLATVGALRDLRLLEPDIEDVVARLYAQSPGTISEK